MIWFDLIYKSRLVTVESFDKLFYNKSKSNIFADCINNYSHHSTKAAYIREQHYEWISFPSMLCSLDIQKEVGTIQLMPFFDLKVNAIIRHRFFDYIFGGRIPNWKSFNINKGEAFNFWPRLESGIICLNFIMSNKVVVISVSIVIKGKLRIEYSFSFYRSLFIIWFISIIHSFCKEVLS